MKVEKYKLFWEVLSGVIGVWLVEEYSLELREVLFLYLGNRIRWVGRLLVRVLGWR